MAQIYRIGQDIYDASNNQKIANPDVLKTQYAGATEIKAPTIPTGATKISDPNYLKTAGLTEKDIFRQGADIYKLPSVMSSDKITGTQAPTIQPVTPSLTDTQPYVAGLAPTTSGLESLVKTALAPTPQEANISPITSKITELTGKFEQKPVDYQSELDKYGFQTNVQDLQNLNTQIVSKKAEYDKIANQVKDSSGLTRIVGGTQDKLARQSAIELGGLSSMAQALQGNVSMAQDIADKTIAIKYEPLEQDIANQKFQLEQVYTQLSRDEKKKADALQITLDERQRLIEEQKTKDADINKIMVTAAENGADSATLQKVLKSKTVGEAIINSGQYIKTAESTTWDTFTDTKTGETRLINKKTGEVKNIGQSTTNIGSPVGEIMGLPSFDTMTQNPGVNRSDRNNNPGNIKVSDYTKTFPGIIGVESSPALDGGNFLIFDSPESGINAIGQLLLTGKSYKGVTAEQAIKKYNGGGAYGATSVGLVPGQDFQSQIQDPVKLQAVATAIAKAEGFTGGVTTKPNETAQSYAKLIQNGTMKLENVPEKLRSEVANILATTPSSKDTAIDLVAKEKAQQALDLQKNKGLNSAVGVVGLGRIAAPWNIGAKQDFIAGVEQLVSGLSLDALIQAKSQGATFGALSDSEMRILASSATKIGTWTKRDKNGKVVGYTASEKSFKDELNNINKILLRGITSSTENQSDVDPLGLGISDTTSNLNNPLGI